MTSETYSDASVAAAQHPDNAARNTLVINLLLVSAFVVMFCFIGAFAARNNLSDLYVIAAFGVLGFLFERWRFPIAPLVLGSILGPLAETTFMTTMISFDNDWTVFFTRPVAGAVMTLAVLAFVLPMVQQFWRRRKTARAPTT